MGWWAVVLILLIGWALVFLEVFIIPGTTLFAIAGAITMLAGVIVAYSQFGVLIGTLTLAITAIFTFFSIVYGLKSGVFKALTLRSTLEGKMNVIDESKIKEHDTGLALSKIAPMGKAIINDNSYEVQSLGEWITEGSTVEVIKVSKNKIIVKLKS